MEGKIAVAGFFHGSDIKFGKDTWDTFELSSRTILSRTIFLALYSPNGTAEVAVEAAACGGGFCDVTSVAADETGIVSPCLQRLLPRQQVLLTSLMLLRRC